MEEGESSEAEWSMEDEGKREDKWGEMGKMTVKENSPNQSVEEEEEEDDDDNSSKEQNIEKEEESSEGKLSLEENASMESAEKEKEDSHDHSDEDSGEEHVMEKEEDSSEGTVCSSIESNSEGAIWPAEMIEPLSQEIKETDAINQNSGEKKANETDTYHFLDCKRMRNIKKSNNQTTCQKAVQAINMINDLTVNHLNQRIWVWSILVLLLLLLLLHIRRTAVPSNLIYHDDAIVP
ncbi:cilia- and flagella-associated protein 251-like isoform X1 [Mangifera indica]|uniref:cilia- and flagella-associated protein 251-like isoform X1 n=1 Tax=Mangifera indica TaxID=29780 RepID=UPI001CFC208D|nr:cilia- and flagella-associated protein 251-like isoform X1 [Mangifera indica]